MREHLLGYLLGALEPEESQRVDERIRTDSQLRQELDALRHCLTPLSVDRASLEPPAGLALRTCRLVAQQSQVVLAGVGSSGSSWRMQDLLVAAGVLIAAAMLFFPAVSHSRHNAQLAACQNNLRQLGQALLHYTQLHGGFFPQIPLEGNAAVAGVVAPVLVDEGHVDGPTWFICPARGAGSEPFRVPSLDELNRADEKALRRLRRRLSGDYGFHLGVMVNGRYEPWRNMGRSTFAVMADTPCWRLAARQSANHGGSGQNVLFEDGHVEFQPTCVHRQVKDNIFRNDEGFVSAGTHLHDAVIGRSDSPPIIFTSGN